MRHRVVVAVAALGLGLVPLAAEASPNDPTGTWLTQDGKARIRVEKCGADRQRVCGYVVWMATPTDAGGELKRDTSNPDSSKRGRTTLGHQLISGFQPNADDHYEGKIYNSENGKSYDANLWSDKPGELKLKGCLVAFLCSTQSWTRVSDVAAGQLAGATGAAGGPQPDPEWATARAAAPKRDAKPKT